MFLISRKLVHIEANHLLKLFMVTFLTCLARGTPHQKNGKYDYEILRV